jgi:malonyl-CoA O-methyltransferase
MSPDRSEDPAARRLPAREGYDLWAEVYDTDGNPLLALEERHIGALIGDVGGRVVVDVGCGTGRHAIRLAAAGARVVALDFSPRMLEVARAKAGAERTRFVRHDVTAPLPLRDGSVDRVLCCLVAEHVADLPALFRELGRVCAEAPRGAVVVSAMHPAMMLRGVQARFRDPRTGARIQPASVPHQVSDYVRAAHSAGLTIEHVGEHAVDASLAAEYPRGARYVGWPMLLLMKLGRRGGAGGTTRAWPTGPASAGTSCGPTPTRA